MCELSGICLRRRNRCRCLLYNISKTTGYICPRGSFSNQPLLSHNIGSGAPLSQKRRSTKRNNWSRKSTRVWINLTPEDKHMMKSIHTHARSRFGVAYMLPFAAIKDRGGCSTVQLPQQIKEVKQTEIRGDRVCPLRWTFVFLIDGGHFHSQPLTMVLFLVFLFRPAVDVDGIQTTAMVRGEGATVL